MRLFSVDDRRTQVYVKPGQPVRLREVDSWELDDGNGLLLLRESAQTPAQRGSSIAGFKGQSLKPWNTTICWHAAILPGFRVFEALEWHKKEIAYQYCTYCLVGGLIDCLIFAPTSVKPAIDIPIIGIIGHLYCFPYNKHLVYLGYQPYAWCMD